jgi:hypothetical protein
MNQPRPDLTKPYATRTERAYDTVVFIRYWQLIEQLMKLVDMQPDAWSAEVRSLFPRSVPGGPPEHPQQRLERWLAVYADEVKILRSIRNQLVHAQDVSDADLRGAVFLSRVVLSTLFGVLPSAVNEDWATSKISTLSNEAGL